MNPTSDAQGPVELLADEFLDRHKRGERPTIREYCERHPELAAEIREVFDHEQGFEDVADLAGQLGVPIAVFLDGRPLAALAAGQKLVSEHSDGTAFIAGGRHGASP